MDLKIPTDEQHKAFIRRLWKICIGAAIGIFIVVGGLMAVLFVKGYDPKKIVEVSTTAFQVLVLSYGMGFFVPAFLTSLINMALGVKMSRAGLEIGEKTAKVLEKVDEGILKRMERLDVIFDRLDKLSAQAEKGEHPLVDKLALDFRTAGDRIRDEVAELRKAFTRPIVPPAPRIVAPPGAIAHAEAAPQRNGS